MNSEQKIIANNINLILNDASKNFHAIEIEETINFVIKNFEKVGIKRIDYVEIRDSLTLENINNNNKSNARLFIAVYINDVRLIDNIKL